MEQASTSAPLGSAFWLDTVAADGVLFGVVNGVTTTGTGGTVRLQATGVTQTAAGVVTSDLLGVRSTTAGNVILDQPNPVNTFAAVNTVAGNRITLRAASGLVLGDVAGQGTFSPPPSAGSQQPGERPTFKPAGTSGQTATGLINSLAFAVSSSAGGTIRLDQANVVATFAGQNAVAGGLLNFRTTGGLTLDTVTSGSALLVPIAGVHHEHRLAASSQWRWPNGDRVGPHRDFGLSQ